MTQPAEYPPHQPFKPSELGPPPISTALLQLVYGLIIPLFTAGLSPELNAARLAAIELVQSYRPRTQPELVLIAKIIAYGLAALDSLRTSMAPDQAVSLKLRLRTNAAALERLAGKNADTLERLRSASPTHASQAQSPTSQSRASRPHAPQPLDPWTAADEADLQGMMENARAIIEAANAELALARAEMPPEAPDDIQPAASCQAEPAPSVVVGPEAQPDAAEPAQPVVSKPAAVTDAPAGGSATGGEQTQRPAAAPSAAAAVTGAADAGAGTAPASPRPVASAPRSAGSPTPAARASLTQAQEGKLLWADAMTVVAKEFTSHPDDADPMLRKADVMRAAILGAAASDLAAEVYGARSSGG